VRRVVFLVDGFNVYHSLKAASREVGLGDRGTRWLDLRALLASYLYLIGENAELERVYYFTAFAAHVQARRPGVVTRHRAYIHALESTAVVPVLGRFTRTQHFCRTCNCRTNRWQEKESDVALGAKLLEVLVRGEAEVAVLVTGDADLTPAIRTARVLQPNALIVVAFPYGRVQTALARLADQHFRISAEAYAKHQLPECVRLSTGRVVQKPVAW
jgi:uncharacterized LabA/DUF88 family protein